MASLKHLITFADITARTTVELGSEPHKFDVAIPVAQRDHLRPVLGSALFYELLNFVQQQTPDTTDPLAELAEEIKDMLCAWTVVEAWPDVLVQLGATGLTTTVGEKTTGATTADVQLTDRTLAHFHNRALSHSAELSRWLFENATTYPSWEKPGGNPSTEMAIGGLYL